MPRLRPARASSAARPARARHDPPPDHRRPPPRDGARRELRASGSRCAAGTPSPRCRPGSPAGCKRDHHRVGELASTTSSPTTRSTPSAWHVVPVGVDLDLFRRCPRSSRVPGRLITTASADVAMKGLRYLLEALAKLRTERDDVHLVVIGSRKEGGASDAHHRAARPRGRRRVRHRRPRASASSSSTPRPSCAVVPSLYEGFSLPGHRGHGLRRARSSPPPAAPCPRSSAPTATPPCSCRPATARRWPPRSAWALDEPDLRSTDRRAPAASGSSTAGRWRHTAVRTVEQYRIRLDLESGARRARADRRLRPARPRSRATCCSTWAAAPAATPSSRSGAAPSVVAFDYAAAELKDVGGLFGAMARGRRGRHRPGALAAAVNGDATRPARSPTTPSTASSPPRCSSTSPTTPAPLAELARVLKPGGTLAVTVPVVAAREDLLGAVRRVPRPVRRGRPRPHLHRGRRCAPGCAAPASQPGAAHHAHALHSPYWWLKCAVGPTNDDHPLVKAYHQLLVWDIADAARPRSPGSTETAAQPGPRQEPRRLRHASPPRPRSPPVAASTVPEVDGVLTADRGRRPPSTPSPSGSCPSGMIPWFPGGHADPWNHVEAAMALDLGGRRAEAERAYEWLVDLQRPDGSWHQYYLGRRRRAGQARRQRRAPTWPPACGTTGCSPTTAGFVEAMWPVVEAAIDFVLDLQTPRGEILWARHADGTPWSLRPAHRLVVDLPQPALRHRHRRAARPRAPRLGALAPPGWPTSIRDVPDAFAPKHRWAMDWYYPVLGGVVRRRRRPRAPRRPARHVRRWTARACAACRDRPWITVAETCECAAGLPRRRRARRWPTTLFGWAQQFRARRRPLLDRHRLPRRGPLPRRRALAPTPRPSVVLAADALAGATPASARCSSTTTAVLPPLMRASRRRPERVDHRPGRSVAQRSGAAEDAEAADGSRDLLEAAASRAPAGRSARTAAGRRRRGRGTRRGCRTCRRGRRAGSSARSRGGPAPRRGRRR